MHAILSRAMPKIGCTCPSEVQYGHWLWLRALNSKCSLDLDIAVAGRWGQLPGHDQYQRCSMHPLASLKLYLLVCLSAGSVLHLLLQISRVSWSHIEVSVNMTVVIARLLSDRFRIEYCTSIRDL